MPRQGSRIDGILNITKPYGMTSMNVVRRLKRAGGLNRVGHGGTLDPIATGVVPVCIGQATRVMEYLVADTKDYKASIEFGVSTDTYDSMGQVTARQDPSRICKADILSVLESFQGVTHQTPPMFSALKRQGKRLYELARSGIEVERESRRVEVFAIELTEWSPPHATVEVKCGRGFYIRSLAHDMGIALGCGAHLNGLVRLRSGPFEISESLSLTEGEDTLHEGTWSDVLHSPDVVLHDLRAAVVGERIQNMIQNGRPVPTHTPLSNSKPGELCRAYSVDGAFIAILVFDGTSGQWKPSKVFAPIGYED